MPEFGFRALEVVEGILEWYFLEGPCTIVQRNRGINGFEIEKIEGVPEGIQEVFDPFSC